MYITGIKFRKHGTKVAKGWRFSAGIGKTRPVVAVLGETQDLESLAHAINFALSGKRHDSLAEVWLDAADDAGDVWTIERGAKGSVFRKNSRILSIDEAQRSLLASLLDLDASLNQAEALVAPVELRQIITRGADVAATTWDMNTRDRRTDVPGLTAARDLAVRCGEKLGRPEFSDPRKLSRIAGPSHRIMGAADELTCQFEQLSQISDKDVKLDASLEAIQVEVDLLNHIDQLIRRINEGGETFGRLSTMLDSHSTRLAEIQEKWGKETLTAIHQMDESCALLDQVVRLRAWGRLVDSLGRVKSNMEDKIRPMTTEGVKVWENFLSGARGNGQEIEGCLASMLLGIKQMGLEVDRYVSQSPASPQIAISRSSNWWDRLKSGSTKVVDERFREAAPALRHQREWVTRLAKEVEAVKVATEYALQSSQGLTDKVGDARDHILKDISALGALYKKAQAEYDRLKSIWIDQARATGIDEDIGMEKLSSLLRDANEYVIIMDTKQDLAVRVEDRKAVQIALEAAVRQWWDVNGSQKTTDLSNISFLIVEAKAALRYRDGRRLRIQKGLEETSRAMGAHSLIAWVETRQRELAKEWAKLFAAAELPALDLSAELTREVVAVAHRCAALLDMARVEEMERFAAASLWPTRLDSAVVVYRWTEAHVPAPQKTSFLKALNSFTGDGNIPVILLISDPELARILANSGTGAATAVETDQMPEVDGPRREGGVVKAELKNKRPISPVTKAPVGTRSVNPASQKSLLNPRAEAALRVLNPKAGR